MTNYISMFLVDLLRRNKESVRLQIIEGKAISVGQLFSFVFTVFASCHTFHLKSNPIRKLKLALLWKNKTYVIYLFTFSMFN